MPGDELVRFRLECSMSTHEQSTDILDRQGLSRFEHDLQNNFHTIAVRFLVRSSMVCYGLVRLNTSFSRLTGHYRVYIRPHRLVRAMLELSHICVCFDDEIDSF